MATAMRSIDVVEVTRAQIDRFAGESWVSVIGSPDVSVKRTDYWYFGAKEPENRPDWVKPTDRNGQPVAWLPRGSAWLRNVDGRAFLYMQNW